jgi:hypothetical protein
VTTLFNHLEFLPVDEEQTQASLRASRKTAGVAN